MGVSLPASWVSIVDRSPLRRMLRLSRHRRPSFGMVQWVFSRWQPAKRVRNHLWTKLLLLLVPELSLSSAEATQPLHARNTRLKKRLHIAALVVVLLSSYLRGRFYQELQPLMQARVQVHAEG